MIRFVGRVVLQILVLGTVFFSQGVQADQQKVTFLTSLDTENIPVCFLRAYYKNYVQKLEETFREQFDGTHYLVEIVQRADQYDLWSALHDPKNVAVFWLSHGSVSAAFDKGERLIDTHAILDWQGFDVTPVFQKIHPNLRFLAVIGCFTNSILDTLPDKREDLKYPDHPYLRTFVFNTRVEARKGLREAIARAKEVLDIPEIKLGYESKCPEIPGYRVEMTRSFLPVGTVIGTVPSGEVSASLFRPAVRMMERQSLLSVFPGIKPNSPPGDQKHTIFIPQDPAHDHLPNLRVDAGTNSLFLRDTDRLRTLDLGALALDLVNQGDLDLEPWPVWHLPDGHLIGVLQRSFKLNENMAKSIPLSKYLARESEFKCDAMPAYESFTP